MIASTQISSNFVARISNEDNSKITRVYVLVLHWHKVVPLLQPLLAVEFLQYSERDSLDSVSSKNISSRLFLHQVTVDRLGPSGQRYSYHDNLSTLWHSWNLCHLNNLVGTVRILNHQSALPLLLLCIRCLCRLWLCLLLDILKISSL